MKYPHVLFALCIALVGANSGIAQGNAKPETVTVHPFAKGQVTVRQLNGDAELATLPAEMQWISEPWNGDNAQMPYLTYIPEKDQVLMLVECGQPIHTALISSSDHGKTWGARRWLSMDKDGQPNANGLGLTYLGKGKFLVYPENLTTQWTSSDYGQTWEARAPKTAGGEQYSWDPALVLHGTNDAVQLAQAWWKPTGVPWGSSEGPYSQAYLHVSIDGGETWINDAKIPQWLGVNEVSIIQAKNGDWVAACRTDNPKRFAHFAFDHYSGLGVSISKDAGKTWSELTILHEWGRHHPSMVLLPDGAILMTYVVRLGYPASTDGFPQFGVEAVVSHDNGQTWDLNHRYVLATWTGNIKGDNAWFCSVQSTSTILLPDGTILTAFGTGFSNTPETKVCKMDIALLRWRLKP